MSDEVYEFEVQKIVHMTFYVEAKDEEEAEELTWDLDYNSGELADYDVYDIQVIDNRTESRELYFQQLEFLKRTAEKDGEE